MATATATLRERGAFGAQFGVIGTLDTYAGAYAAGGDTLLASELGLEQIDDVILSPGLDGGVPTLGKYIRDSSGINGRVQFFKGTTGAEITLDSERPNGMEFIAFGR